MIESNEGLSGNGISNGAPILRQDGHPHTNPAPDYGARPGRPERYALARDAGGLTMSAIHPLLLWTSLCTSRFREGEIDAFAGPALDCRIFRQHFLP
jgi:hypothetical protein